MFVLHVISSLCKTEIVLDSAEHTSHKDGNLFITEYILTPLEYKQIINDIKIKGNCKRKIVEETTKSADAPKKHAPVIKI